MTADEYRAQDAAWSKQYDEEQAAKAVKPPAPKGFDIFMQDPGERPTDKAVLAAVATADHLGTLAHHIYHHTRDDVVTFISHREPGKLDDAIARLCVPLVGYARVLGRLTIIAKHGQIYADKGVKPEKQNLADVHALGQHTQGYFLDALRLADPRAHIAYVSLIVGELTEEELDAHLCKHVKPIQAAILTLAACILKDGMRATHAAIEGGAKSTDDLIPARSTTDKMRKLAENTGGMHLTPAAMHPKVKEYMQQNPPGEGEDFGSYMDKHADKVKAL